jgi:hypothetical protein
MMARVEQWIPLITALVGSAGAAGILTGGLQLSRATRLRKRIGELTEIAKSFESGDQRSKTAWALVDEDLLRMAGLMLIRVPRGFYFGAVLLFAWAGVLVPYIIVDPDNWIPDPAPRSPGEWVLSIMTIVFTTIVMAAVLVATIAQRRQAFVAQLRAGKEPTSELVEAYTPFAFAKLFDVIAKRISPKEESPPPT